MFGTVLVTLDGSRLSEAALDVAVRLVAGTETQIILLSVGDPLPEFDTEVLNLEQPTPELNEAPGDLLLLPREARAIDQRARLYEQRRNELMRYLTPHLERLQEQGLRVSAAVAFGDAAASIIRFARTHDIDVIVMATHGRTGLAHLLYGSVAERVVASGVAPVLLVRPTL